MTIYEFRVRKIKAPAKRLVVAWSGTAKQLSRILRLRKDNKK